MRLFYFTILYAMKVLSSSQIREADRYTMQHEPIASIDLMERASSACVTHLLELFPNTKHYSIYCGTGNNGGDGLAIARLLSKKKLLLFVRYSTSGICPNKGEGRPEWLRYELAVRRKVLQLYETLEKLL